jgi:hypothetical protein
MPLAHPVNTQRNCANTRDWEADAFRERRIALNPKTDIGEEKPHDET